MSVESVAELLELTARNHCVRAPVTSMTRLSEVDAGPLRIMHVSSHRNAQALKHYKIILQLLSIEHVATYCSQTTQPLLLFLRHVRLKATPFRVKSTRPEPSIHVSCTNASNSVSSPLQVLRLLLTLTESPALTFTTENTPIHNTQNAKIR